jgi:hypothetical protein
MGLVPAHVGDRVLRRKFEANDVASEDAQALVLAVLETPLHKQLQTQANAEEGLAAMDRIQQRLNQLAAMQFGNGVLKGADAGKDNFRGPMKCGWVAGDYGWVARLLEPFLHTAQIAHPVVDNGDHDAAAAEGEKA